MKILQASSNLDFLDIDVTDEKQVYRKIEKIARVCYKSEGRMSETSYEDLINKLKFLKHTPMLEHHTCVMEVSEKLYTDLIKDKYKFMNYSGSDNRYIISGNITALMQAPRNVAMDYVLAFLNRKFPLLFSGCQFNTPVEESTGYALHLMNSKEIEYLPYTIRRDHATVTAFFLVDRGVSHEIVRHRPPSFGQESTRYCNYAHEKYEGDLQWILPVWMDRKFIGTYKFRETIDLMSNTRLATLYNTENPEIIHSLAEDEIGFFQAIQSSENSYLRLRELGWVPQQARDVLCHSLKVEMYMTATLTEWEHFFKMRVPTTAHCQMREVTIPLQTEFLNQQLMPVSASTLCEEITLENDIYMPHTPILSKK